MSDRDDPAEDPYAPIRLDRQICFPLYACAKEIVRRYRAPLKRLGLTYTQYIVMMALWEHREMSEKDLGGRVHLDSGTLAPLLKRLEGMGLVGRRRSPDDERVLLITLTGEGEAMKDDALSVPREMGNCLGLDEADLATLYLILYKALDHMQECNRTIPDD